MRQLLPALFTIFILVMSLNTWSCKHDPTMPEDSMTPVDTMDIDTIDNPVDTSDITPCDSNTVYFNQQVLPILKSNCAFSACHDAASAQGEVILDNYNQVVATAGVEPFDLQGSDLYEAITEDDEDKRMPPIPRSPLTPEQIQIISAWILQGAENEECDPDAEACDTDNVSFVNDLQPILNNTCVGCHSGSAPAGGIILGDYDGVKVVVDDGRLLGAINWESGFSSMPQGGEQLSDCVIDQFTAWINDGALNN
ncbi:MAG: hypothetical protein MI974_07990 [Chitinophagales bacterium]|nr:hypothetical protein [Chitinophagales bacterium]